MADPREPKPTPERYCAACGQRMERRRLKNGELESLLHFNRKVYCDRECMKVGFRAKPKKPDSEVGWMVAHDRARKIKPRGPCERCGSSRSEVHHKNGDWRDNSLENLERVCRSCHMKAHESHKRLPHIPS